MTESLYCIEPGLWPEEIPNGSAELDALVEHSDVCAYHREQLDRDEEDFLVKVRVATKLAFLDFGSAHPFGSEGLSRLVDQSEFSDNQDPFHSSLKGADTTLEDAYSAYQRWSHQRCPLEILQLRDRPNSIATVEVGEGGEWLIKIDKSATTVQLWTFCRVHSDEVLLGAYPLVSTPETPKVSFVSFLNSQTLCIKATVGNTGDYDLWLSCTAPQVPCASAFMFVNGLLGPRETSSNWFQFAPTMPVSYHDGLVSDVRMRSRLFLSSNRFQSSLHDLMSAETKSTKRLDKTDCSEELCAAKDAQVRYGNTRLIHHLREHRTWGEMFDSAYNDALALVPLPIQLAHRLAQRLSEARKSGQLPYLRPDGKSQVKVEYRDGQAFRVDEVFIRSQGANITSEHLSSEIDGHIRERIFPEELRDCQANYHLNVMWRFGLVEQQGYSSLTGRNIIIDTCSGYAPEHFASRRFSTSLMPLATCVTCNYDAVLEDVLGYALVDDDSEDIWFQQLWRRCGGSYSILKGLYNLIGLSTGLWEYKQKSKPGDDSRGIDELFRGTPSSIKQTSPRFSPGEQPFHICCKQGQEDENENCSEVIEGPAGDRSALTRWFAKKSRPLYRSHPVIDQSLAHGLSEPPAKPGAPFGPFLNRGRVGE